MRKIGWKIAVLIGAVLLCSSYVFAQGFSGWFDIVNSTSRAYEDGERTTSSDLLNRNLYLNFQKSITPMLSYQINLRTNFTDTDVTDADGIASTTYRRSLEPAMDIIFGNPVYNLSTGYRRQEQWTTAHLSNDSRTTTEFYYSRFNVSPKALPSLNLQFDRQKNYDHLSDRELDTTNTSYSVGSAYDLPSRDMRFRYNINYSRVTNKTPLSTTSKTINENFNGSYNIGYSDTLWSERADYSFNYQGNYSRNKTKQFVVQTGTILNERTPLGGFYAQGDAIQPDVDVLLSQGDLIDDDVNTSTGIGLSTSGSDEYQNIGILVSSARSVDRLYIYVNKDVTTDITLQDPNSWSLFKSNFNQAGTWSQITIKSVTVETVDSINDIYRYEIEFMDSQNASFFKVVNSQVSDVSGVFVTEIEAYGTDVPDEATLISVTNAFTQGLNFSAGIKVLTELTLRFHYSIDRTDQNPESFTDSVSGVFSNIFSDSETSDKSNFRSNVTRNYGMTSTWLTHRLLTTIFRIQRNESFDNQEETDVSSNTYNLSFNSSPLPTVDANLSLIRNDSFSFSEKESTNTSMLLSIGSKLYRDVNMITDLGYTRSKSHRSDSTTASRQINGSLDAILTRKLSGTLNYGFNWISSDGTSSNSKEGSVIITYRPGKFVNINGNMTISDSDGDVSTTEGILVDWLPLRAVRLNMNYQHSDSEPGPVKSDTVGGYVIWYVTKFADLRFTYNYTQQKEDKKTESYNFNTNLNCRF